MTETLAAVGIGLLLGILTGLPLGVVNVAIVEASLAGEKRFAIHVGLGGAFADAIHAGLAFAGTGHVITRYPEYTRTLAVVAAVVIVGYVLIARRRKREHAKHRHGVVTGFLLTLPNPGALAAWVAVAGAIWPDITVTNALVLAPFVGIGSAIYFTLLATLSSRVHRDHPGIRIVPRVAMIALVVLAAVGIVRAFA